MVNNYYWLIVVDDLWLILQIFISSTEHSVWFMWIHFESIDDLVRGGKSANTFCLVFLSCCIICIKTMSAASLSLPISSFLSVFLSFFPLLHSFRFFFFAFCFVFVFFSAIESLWQFEHCFDTKRCGIWSFVCRYLNSRCSKLNKKQTSEGRHTSLLFAK